MELWLMERKQNAYLHCPIFLYLDSEVVLDYGLLASLLTYLSLSTPYPYVQNVKFWAYVNPKYNSLPDSW